MKGPFERKGNVGGVEKLVKNEKVRIAGRVIQSGLGKLEIQTGWNACFR